jgi:long-chain acyl-CoA synthetase
MFERLIEELCFAVGASVGFFRGDISKIFEDINALKPTIFVSVPRIYSRLSERIRDSVAKQGFLNRALFNLALWSKKANLRRNQTSHWLWDKLVFSKMTHLMGGRVRIMVWKEGNEY